MCIHRMSSLELVFLNDLSVKFNIMILNKSEIFYRFLVVCIFIKSLLCINRKLGKACSCIKPDLRHKGYSKLLR